MFSKLSNICAGSSASEKTTTKPEIPPPTITVTQQQPGERLEEDMSTGTDRPLPQLDQLHRIFHMKVFLDVMRTIRELGMIICIVLVI